VNAGADTVVAAITCSRLPGSTASAKNASPANVGAPGAATSGTQVAPPSSERIGPMPRYAGSALTIRAAKIWWVSPSPVPTYTRSGSAGSIAIAPHARLELAKFVGSTSKPSISEAHEVPPSSDRKTPPHADAA
jgi:hypothetical protein